MGNNGPRIQHACLLQNIKGILPLKDTNVMPRSSNLNTQEIPEQTKIFSFENANANGPSIEKSRTYHASNDNIIHIENQIVDTTRSMVIENRMVSFTPSQSKRSNYRAKATKPTPRRLIQTIQGLLEVTNQVRLPEQQTQVVALCKPPLEDHHKEKYFYVKLMKRSISNGRHEKKETN